MSMFNTFTGPNGFLLGTGEANLYFPVQSPKAIFPKGQCICIYIIFGFNLLFKDKIVYGMHHAFQIPLYHYHQFLCYLMVKSSILCSICETLHYLH